MHAQVVECYQWLLVDVTMFSVFNVSKNSFGSG